MNLEGRESYGPPIFPATTSVLGFITSLPLLLRTAITAPSLCTSTPIYLMSRLTQLPFFSRFAYLLL
jgi:hypothetical protein